MMETTVAKAVVTMMFMPAILFAIICGVCILKLIAYYIFRCFRGSKHDYLFEFEWLYYILG